MPAERAAVVCVAWLATYWLQSSLVLGVLAAARRALRSRSERLRELMWRVALVVPIASASVQVMSSAEPWLGSVRVPGAGAIGVAQMGLGGAEGSRGGGPAWSVVVAAFWAILAAAGAAQLVWAHRRFVRGLAGRRLVILPPDIASAARGARVTASDAVTSPVALGGEICLPVRALTELDRDELRAVVAHESAHLGRHDARWRWTAAIIARVFFFQPFNRIAQAELRELAECLCDDDAVARTAEPIALASALAAVARWAQGATSPSLVPGMASAESLAVRRVRRMLAPLRVRSTASPRGGSPAPLASTVAGATIALMVAFAAPGVRADPAVAAASAAYTIQATDPAGQFTLVLAHGRVLAATIDGRPVPTRRVVQRGSTLHLIGDDGTPFAIELLARGGIHWSARPPRRPITS